MKKRQLIYSVAVIAAFVVLAFPWFRPGSGVTMLNYWRIQAGMSANEVEELLKAPDTLRMWRRGTLERVPNQGWIEYWRSDRNGITIVYDVNGIVVEKEWNWIVDTAWEAAH